MTQKKRSVELDMIKRDTAFYHDLALQLQSSKISSVLILALLPYLSLFVLETYKYFDLVMSDYAKEIKRQHEDIIRTSRTRIKLFEVAEISNLIQWISELHADRFINSHKGFLSGLKRLLSTDLGLFIYDNHLIGTTHIAHFNLGYEKEDLLTSEPRSTIEISTLLRSIGFDIGEYIGTLYNDFELNLNDRSVRFCSYRINDELLLAKDIKSDRYYESIFNGAEAIQINSCLTLFLATVNFVEHVFRYLVVETPDTFFKVKFIALYHLASSLKKFQNFYYPSGLLTKGSKEFLKEIISNRDLKKIESKSDFRNILVHYSIRDIPDGSLIPNTRLYGLVEYYFDGLSFGELNVQIDDQIRRISEILSDWSNQAI